MNTWAPTPGYARRMRVYFAEMYPLPARLLLSILLYMSFVVFLRSVHDRRTSVVTAYSLAGIFSVFALTLILRLMDELKDKEIDRELFRTRPLPSGRVLESDIRFSLVAVMTLYLAANAWVGAASWMAIFVLGYALLMAVYFFIPNIMRNNLLLALVTHNPIILFMLLYVTVLFSVESSLGFGKLNWPVALLGIAMYWAPSFAWEIARKIRAPQSEDEYETYSRIFGYRKACRIVTALVGLIFAEVLWVSRFYAAGVILLGGVGAATAYVAYRCLRFATAPTPGKAPLRPVMETYLPIFYVAFTIVQFFQ